MTVPTDPAERRLYLDRLACRVRDREPGWEDAWSDLVTGLIPDLQRLLRSQGKSIPGGQEGLEEALSGVLFYWQEKVSAGTLLRRWQSSCPVAGYLCHRIAVNIARNGVRRLIAHALGGEEGEAAMDDSGIHQGGAPARDDDHPSTAADAPLPGDATCHFLPLAANGVTQMHVVAGLQLFRQLDWQHHAGPAVAAAMPDFLAGITDGAWHEGLERAHEQAQRALSAREQALMDQLCNDGKGVSPRMERTLQNKLLKVRVEQRLHPIAAEQMMALTAASRNVCDQHRSRFRRQHQTVVVWLRDDDEGLTGARGMAS